MQTNIVRRDGRRAVLMTILKGEGASTLSVVKRVRAALPGIQAQLPPELKLELLFDQSVFVRAAVEGVLKEGAIAAGLTALMILLFLGSWRSTLIVATSIPLSILTSIIVLWALGQSLNTMTLGGMALAVGILVDDATVEIENVHRNLAMKKPLRRAILDGAAQIAMPAFVSTLAICIVFVPVVFLTGPAAYLFTPLALAVVFAMLASYFLSRTLVPTMVLYLLPPEARARTPGGDEEPASHGSPGGRDPPSVAFHHAFNRGFERLRLAYQRPARLGPRPPLRHGDRAARLRPRLAGACSPGSARTSSRPSTPASSGCTSGRRPARASRRPSASSARSRTPSARSCPTHERAMILDNMGLTPVVHDHGLRRQRHGQRRRRRDPGVAQAGPPADRGLRRPAAGRVAPAVPGLHVLSSSRPTSPARS